MSSSYSVESETSFKDVFPPSGIDLVKTTDGGYAFAASSVRGDEAKLVKVNSQGNIQWVHTTKGRDALAQQWAKVAIAEDTGEMIFAGYSNSHDLVGHQWDALEKEHAGSYLNTPKVGFVEKLSKSGEVVWRKAYGEITKRNSDNKILRGLAVSDGYVFLGSVYASMVDNQNPNGQRFEDLPWVFKISKDGDLLWQTIIESHDNEKIGLTHDVDVLSNLCINQDGGIAFSAIIHTSSTSTNSISNNRATSINAGRQTLVVALDSHGREIYSRIEDYGVNQYLLSSDDGFDFVFNKPAPFHDGFYWVKLKKDLSLTSKTFIESRRFWPKRLIRSNENGLHVLGTDAPDGGRGNAAIAFLQNNGSLSSLKELGRNSWAGDIVLGKDQDNIAVIWYSSDELTKITKLKIK